MVYKRVLILFFEVKMMLKALLVVVSVVQVYGKYEFLTGNGGRLLVVSMDAFRSDYVSRGITPYINEIREKSTRSILYNIFPTVTYPNHFTMATGLYAEEHGVIGNLIYDRETKTVLDVLSYKFWHYNPKVVPIWTLNEMQGGVSGAVMWPGSYFEYAGRNITYSIPYNESTDFQKRIDAAVSILKGPNPANLVFLYFQEPDSTAHLYGPNSPQTDEMIHKMDGYVKSIMDCLKSNGLDDVNVIFLSDHGMEEVRRQDVMRLDQWIGDKADQYGYSPVLQIYPKPGQEKEVYSILKRKMKEIGHFNVYKKSEIPDRYRYKHNERSPPILAVAEPKYAFYDQWHQWIDEEHDDGKYAVGVHGYDPKDKNMHPIFFAYGPAFRKNVDVSLETIEMFEIFSKVIGLNISSVNKEV